MRGEQTCIPLFRFENQNFVSNHVDAVLLSLAPSPSLVGNPVNSNVSLNSCEKGRRGSHTSA